MKKINDTHKEYLPIRCVVAQYNRNPENYIFHMKSRRPSFSLGYIIRGSVTFYTPDGSVRINAGELHYVPYGIRYRSEWSGEDGSEYISVYGYPGKSNIPYVDSYALQRVDGFCAEEGYRRLLDIYNTASSGQDQFVLFQKFFELFSMIRPHLATTAQNEFSSALMNAVSYIEAHHSEPLSIPALAYAVGVSESTVYHLFKKELATTPIHYYNLIRIEKVIVEMGSDDSINDIAYRHGFNSYSYFRELFKAQTGLTPRQYRLKNYGR